MPKVSQFDSRQPVADVTFFATLLISSGVTHYICSLNVTHINQNYRATPPNCFNQQSDKEEGSKRHVVAEVLATCRDFSMDGCHCGGANAVQGRVSLFPLAGVMSSHCCARVTCVKLASV